MKEVLIASIPELASFAENLVGELASTEGACILALVGELGAGKTALTKEIARVLGVEEMVGSPTFLVMKRYPLHNQKWATLVHLDAYRVDDPGELSILKIEETLGNQGNLVAVEWADRVSTLIPARALWVTIELSGNETRTIRYGKKTETN